MKKIKNFNLPFVSKKKIYSNFFNPGKIANSKHQYHFWQDERNQGKTANILRLCFDRFFQNPKRQFIFIRRTTTELEFFAIAIKSKLAEIGKDISAFEFKMDGIKCNNEYFIFYLSLNAIDTNRFNVFQADRIDLIVFDEFVRRDGKYLKNEVERFFDLLGTMLRLRDDQDYKIIFLANYSNQPSPYHLFFKLPNSSKKQLIYLSKTKISYVGWGAQIRNFKKNAIQNQYEDFQKYSKKPIKFVPSNFKFRINFLIQGQLFGLGQCERYFLLHSKMNKTGSIVILSFDDLGKGALLTKELAQLLKQSILYNYIKFENDWIRNIFLEDFKKVYVFEKILL